MPEFTALFETSQVQIITWLVIADFLLAVLSSFMKKDFSLRKLGNLMGGPVLSYIFGFAVIQLVGQAQPQFGFLVQAVFIIIVIALGASILRNLGRFGLPLPGIFTK